MFKSVHISCFRGVRKADIHQLKRINLFFGKNNCGKSSILEAIFLLCGPSNPLRVLTINTLRGYIGVSEKDLTLDFYHLKSEDIFLSGQGDSKCSLRIYRTRSESVEVEVDDLRKNADQVIPEYHGIGLDYIIGDNENVYRSRLMVSPDLKKINIKKDKDFQETFNSEYIPANYLQMRIHEKYAHIVKQKDNQVISDVLCQIEPRIRSVQLIGDEVMVDVGLPQLLPLNMLGDGIRKIFSILVTIASCKDGVLLIDEVDNGFHYSAMKILWTAIFLMSRENNVQLFITSHNIDSVKGLLQACMTSDDNQKSLSVYKLIRKEDDEVLSLCYDYQKLQYMIEQEMEMR